jgi:hypothetical protein
MDLQELREELDTDPAGLGYGAQEASVVAGLLNSLKTDRTRQSTTVLQIDEAVTLVDYGEYRAALADTTKAQILSHLFSMPMLSGSAFVQAALLDVFGAESATMQNVAAALSDPCSRADELGLGLVRNHHVRDARAL